MKNHYYLVPLWTVLLYIEAFSFIHHAQFHQHSPTYRRRNNRQMAGFGNTEYGPVSKVNKNKNKKKHNTKKQSSSSSSSFDVHASLVRLENKYNDYILAATKQDMKKEQSNDDMITNEYVVAVRVVSNMKKKKSGGITDWVPVAQFCIVCPNSEYRRCDDDNNTDELLLDAISLHCREFFHCAVLSSSVYSTVGRSDVQYSIEPLDSFYKYVYETLVEDKYEMSKSEARDLLELNTDAALITRKDIKQAYRDKSLQFHPDRNNDNKAEASKTFRTIRLAHDVLMSGIRDNGSPTSWYESLGGKDRTDFMSIQQLVPIDTAKKTLDRRQTKSALFCLDKDLVQSFIARNTHNASAP